MFAKYVDKAMQHAKVEQIEDGTYYGSIPDFNGVWSNATTEDLCKQELREVLEAGFCSASPIKSGSLR